MQRFCQDLSDRSVISVTDKAAKWVNPVRTSAPVKITSLDLRSEPTGQPPIKPTSDHYRPSCHNMSPHAVEKEMLRLIKSENLPACAAYVLSDSSGSEYDFECLPVNILDLATQFNNDDSPDDSLESFIEHIHRNIPDNYFTDIFEKTISQSDSDLWFYQRHGRITASILYSCLHFSGRNPDGHLVKLILGLTNSVNSDLPALRHGKKFEHVARESYLHDKKNLHDNLECKLSGFVIDNNSPYLGCSPDGLLECKCCGQGCLEIKCPYKFSEETPINAACLDKTNFHIENDTPLMKRNDTSPYYCQIQCQLAVTKRKWCDFVLFTFKGVHHERIPFDEQFWSNVFPKLASFYSSYVLPKILLV